MITRAHNELHQIITIAAKTTATRAPRLGFIGDSPEAEPRNVASLARFAVVSEAHGVGVALSVVVMDGRCSVLFELAYGVGVVALEVVDVLFAHICSR